MQARARGAAAICSELRARVTAAGGDESGCDDVTQGSRDVVDGRV